MSTAAPAVPLSTRHRTLIMGCTMIATLMQALDNTIANVALPHMQGSLGTNRDQITWVLTSYVIAAAIMTAPVGWFAARFGRKEFFLVSLIGFTITSMMCGLAQTVEQEVLFRFLQGCFGAALVPLSQAIMLDIYPAEQRGMAMSIWATGVMIGPILGPTLGGWLTDTYDWRWVFFINVPFGIAAVAGLMLFLKERKPDATLRFDWLGFLALGLALTAFQLMLDRGSIKDWFNSNEIIVEATLAGLGLLHLHRPHADGREALHPAAHLQGFGLPLRRRHDVRGRRHPARKLGAAAALSPEPRRLPRHRRGTSDGAARHRRDAGDDHRRTAHEDHRSAPADGCGRAADRRRDARHGLLDPRHRRVAALRRHHDPGRRHLAHLHPAAGRRLRDARPCAAHRRGGALFAVAQHRQRDRRLGDLGPAHVAASRPCTRNTPSR